MGLRRSADQSRARRQWAGFVAANLERFQTAGLPLLATQSVAHWDDLLLHGHFDYHEDPSHFRVDQLTTDQYDALVGLVESYFVVGYEYFTPLALKIEDQARLSSRFEG